MQVFREDVEGFLVFLGYKVLQHGEVLWSQDFLDGFLIDDLVNLMAFYFRRFFCFGFLLRLGFVVGVARGGRVTGGVIGVLLVILVVFRLFGGSFRPV